MYIGIRGPKGQLTLLYKTVHATQDGESCFCNVTVSGFIFREKLH